MNSEHPIIAVVGAGAVGGYYGARLAQHGFDVHFLMRSDYGHVRERGMRIKSVDGDFELGPSQVHVYNEPAKMPRADLVLVTLKTTANGLFEQLIGPLLQEDTAILTLQNGLGNEARLASLFGEARVLGGMAFVCINRTGPGMIHHMDHGLIKFGEFQRVAGERTRKIGSWFSKSGVVCQVLDDVERGRWEKLVWNIPFNGLGALLDLTTDKLIDNPTGEKLVRTLMREVATIFGTSHVAFNESIIDEKIIHTQTMGAYRTSTQIDRQNGSSMEVEAIFGEALRDGRRLNVATPYLEMLYSGLSLLNSAR